jgi:hypothetical protein
VRDGGMLIPPSGVDSKCRSALEPSARRTAVACQSADKGRDTFTDGGTVIPPHERKPKFIVSVTLDGDDWPPTATRVVEAQLEQAVTAMKAAGLIRAGTISSTTGKDTAWTP